MSFNPDFNDILGWADTNEQRSKGEKYKTIKGILASWYESGAYGVSWADIASHLPSSPPQGRCILRYNTDESETRIYYYTNSAWQYLGIPDPAGVTDHGALSGLDDPSDHPWAVTVADLINDGVGLGSRMVGHHSNGYGVHTVHDMFNHITPTWMVDGGVVSDDGGLDISWTAGNIYDSQNAEDINDFVSGLTTLTNNSKNYLYYDTSVGGTTLSVSTGTPLVEDVIIAVIRCQDGDIWSLGQYFNVGETFAATLHGLSEMFPSFITSGMGITPHITPLAVDMGAGHLHQDVFRGQTVAAIDTTTNNLVRWFHNAGVWDSDTSALVDVIYYDNGTNKTAIGSNKFVKGLFFYTSGKLHYVYPAEEFTNLANAIIGDLPILPPAFDGVAKVFAVVLQEGDTTLPSEGNIRWVDLRINSDNLIFNGNVVTDHGALTGLDDDDHGGIYYNKTAINASLAAKLSLTGGTLTGGLTVVGDLLINTINERTLNAGVTIESICLEDHGAYKSINKSGSSVWYYLKDTSGTPKIMRINGDGVAGRVHFYNETDAKNIDIRVGQVVSDDIAQATTDTDKFLVSDGGIIKYRSGTQLLSDLGAGAGNLPPTQTMIYGGTDGAGFSYVNGVANNYMTVNKFMGFNLVADRTSSANVILVTIGNGTNASFDVVSKVSTLNDDQTITAAETSSGTLNLSITDNKIEHHTLHSSLAITEGQIVSLYLNNLEYTDDLHVVAVYLEYI